MFETHLTVVGRIVTDLRRKPVNGQELISFRVASNSRRRNGDGIWEPGNSLFIIPIPVPIPAPLFASSSVSRCFISRRLGSPVRTSKLASWSASPNSGRYLNEPMRSMSLCWSGVFMAGPW